MKTLRITEENFPLLVEELGADQEWIASLTSKEKQNLIDKTNLLIEQYYNDKRDATTCEVGQTHKIECHRNRR